MAVKRPLPSNKVPQSYSQDQNSPLHYACFRGDYDEVLMLLLRGEDVHALNIWRETPLHQCTNRGHLDVMLLLLDSGAKVNALDHQNLTPLHQAVIHANKDAAELLLCYGADVFNAHYVTDTLAVVELAQSVHACHSVITQAVGRVWSLQHLCRTAIRQCLGARFRRRLKELPLPKHLLSYLTILPVTCWEQLRYEGLKGHSSKIIRGQRRLSSGQRRIAASRISEQT